MAIPHFQITAHSRGKGASAIAKAAYNSGARLHDLDGSLHAYDRKGGIRFHRLCFSPNAENPESREAFWQNVERSEKRKDACVCREFLAALPCELTYEQNLRLVQELTDTLLARYQFRAVDVSVHYPTRWKPNAKKHENPHVHILAPDRNATGKKIGLNHNRNEIFALRDIWEKTVNSHLAAAGLETRISL